MASIELRSRLQALRADASYGVRDVSLRIEDGEFIIFLGPSGCGKSTTLRMIAGLESISDGEILIGGKIVNALPPRDRNVAVVFQSYALYPHMSVAQNMAFGLKMRGTAARPHSNKGRPRPPRSSDSTPISTASRPPCRADNASASRSAAPSCATRLPFCSTSRCPTSTRNCGARCGSNSSSCIAGLAAPSCMSRTIRSKR